MQDYERDQVLEQYDIAVDSTRKTRGAILCSTDQGVLILKEIHMTENRIPVFAELYEYLSGQDEILVDQPIRNREGSYVTALTNGNKYMLRRQPPGMECDVKRMPDILRAAGTLAKIHTLLQKPLENPVSCGESLKNEYRRHDKELRKVRSYIRGVSPKREFEALFLKHFEQMYLWTSVAAEELERSNYDHMYQECIEKGYLIHGEYNYHNILMHIDNESREYRSVSVINFDRFQRNVQVEDLYYFMRKVLEKHGFKERVGEGILNAYSAIKPLTSDEMEYLKIRMLYPEKFWKIASSYYHSNKAWISAKSIEKMQMSVRQTREKEQFLRQIFAFHL